MVSMQFQYGCLFKNYDVIESHNSIIIIVLTLLTKLLMRGYKKSLSNLNFSQHLAERLPTRVVRI